MALEFSYIFPLFAFFFEMITLPLHQLYFFSPIYSESARRAMNDMADCLKSGSCSVAIFDATNTTRERRKTIDDFCKENWLDFSSILLHAK